MLDKLRSRQATIGVIGLGYVGLPLSLTYAEAGYRVLGFDIDKVKVNAINNGQSYIKHIHCDRVVKAQGLFEATTDFSRTATSDSLILCVPTPLNQYREPDLSFIRATMKNLLPYLRPGQVLSLESTTYPGTTEEELRPLIEQCGLKVGEDAFLVYSPEREDPGNAHFNTATIPKVLGGSTPACTEVGVALYEQAISEVVAVSSTRAAEMTKLLENIHRAVNIGLMNELKPLAACMGIDLYEVIEAAATKPFGFVPYYPGPGLGGHCIPIDPFYLTWKAREYGMHTRFIELAGEINTSMPKYVVSRTADALNLAGKPLNGSSVLVLGIAYKKNVDDMRESPSVELMALLTEKGSLVSYSDPFFDTFPPTRKHKFTLKSVQLTRETISSYDAVIVATDHDAFNFELIGQYAPILIDTRGRFATNSKIVRA
ncbi:nucleotide sugar dehydrogenase family protein [Synechococcus sp. BOUM118]|nr:nucleotide sugar dehydrogenase family protein [Synechococcus sp. BOUM118]